MKIKDDIQQLLHFNFTQKEAVRELLRRGYTKDEIRKVIYTFYPNKPTDDRGPFILSVLGQLLLIGYCIPALTVSGYHIFRLVLVVQLILLGGFCTKNRFFVYACTGVFFLAALIFAVISFSATGWSFNFVFALAASFFGRVTYKVAGSVVNKHELYQFE